MRGWVYRGPGGDRSRGRKSSGARTGGKSRGSGGRGQVYSTHSPGSDLRSETRSPGDPAAECGRLRWGPTPRLGRITGPQSGTEGGTPGTVSVNRDFFPLVHSSGVQGLPPGPEHRTLHTQTRCVHGGDLWGARTTGGAGVGSSHTVDFTSTPSSTLRVTTRTGRGDPLDPPGSVGPTDVGPSRPGVPETPPTDDKETLGPLHRPSLSAGRSRQFGVSMHGGHTHTQREARGASVTPDTAPVPRPPTQPYTVVSLTRSPLRTPWVSGGRWERLRGVVDGRTVCGRPVRADLRLDVRQLLASSHLDTDGWGGPGIGR